MMSQLFHFCGGWFPDLCGWCNVVDLLYKTVAIFGELEKNPKRSVRANFSYDSSAIFSFDGQTLTWWNCGIVNRIDFSRFWFSFFKSSRIHNDIAVIQKGFYPSIRSASSLYSPFSLYKPIWPVGWGDNIFFYYDHVKKTIRKDYDSWSMIDTRLEQVYR